MFPDPRLDLVLIVVAFSAIAAFIGYWAARGQLEPQLRELKSENDAYAEWIDTLVDLERAAAKQRHPANRARALTVITGGAS